MATATFITATDAGGPAEEKKDLKKLGSKARAFGGTFRRMTIQSCQMVFDAVMPVVFCREHIPDLHAAHSHSACWVNSHTGRPRSRATSTSAAWSRRYPAMCTSGRRPSARCG